MKILKNFDQIKYPLEDYLKTTYTSMRVTLSIYIYMKRYRKGQDRMAI